MNDVEFREYCFIYHAALNIAAEAAVILELKENSKEIEEIRQKTNELNNKWNKKLSPQFLNNRNILIDKAFKELKRIAKKYIK